MKKQFQLALSGSLLLISELMVSCGGTKQFLETSVSEEYSLSLVKLTDESQNRVWGCRNNLSSYNILKSGVGASREKNFIWASNRYLAISPDGTEFAYIGTANDAPNVMIKKAQTNSASTQRTFRKALDIYWSKDGRIYFNDNTSNHSSIGSVDAHKGSLVKQLTSNNNDWSPAITENQELMYFTRFDSSGPSIWCLNLKNGELSNCARGFNPTPFNDDPYKIICSRNSTSGNTEIWLLDFKNGSETMLVSDSNIGFSSPVVSPNGEWILAVGNSYSAITKKQNTDIYAIRIDGTNLTQLTYHPAVDCCPVWSPDGKYIYFISSRANVDNKFNVWRMNNPLK